MERFEGPITVEVSVTGRTVASRDVETLAEALRVAEEFGRSYAGRGVTIQGYRADELDYCPEYGASDGLEDDERDDIEAAVEQGQRFSKMPRESREALAALNLHRRAIGMQPLDPSAGWTSQEILTEVQRLQQQGLLRINPSGTVRALKQRLL